MIQIQCVTAAPIVPKPAAMTFNPSKPLASAIEDYKARHTEMCSCGHNPELPEHSCPYSEAFAETEDAVKQCNCCDACASFCADSV